MSWEQLEAIERDNRKQVEWERKQPPERCPHDGSLLVVRRNVRDCPMGNYTWEG